MPPAARRTLLLLAVFLAAGWWLRPHPPQARSREKLASHAATPPAPPVTAEALRPTAAASPEDPRENSGDTGAASRHDALRRRVLELAAGYETRREADDPAGADSFRLHFEELLDDETAPLLVRTLPADFLETFFGDLSLRRWAEHDRAVAAAWMAAHPAASPVPASALAHGWVTGDPAALHAYLDSLPAGEWKHLVAKAAGEEALVADRPDEALRLLGKITGDDARRDELYEWTATKWALSDPASAAAWAAQAAAADPARGEGLLAAVAVGYANHSPEEAARWALNAIEAPAALHAALPAIVRVWAAKDAQAAARWTQTFPAGALQDEALDGLLSVWAVRDLAAAKAWRDTLLDVPARQRADRLLASLEAEVNPASP